MTLGQKLKELRSKNGLTQKDLADKLHVSFQTVSKWENGENEPDIATLKELAALFSCSVDYLIGGENESPSPTPETTTVQKRELHVCEKCGKDIPEGQEVLENYLKMEGKGTRKSDFSTAQRYYHRDCFEEVKKERAEANAIQNEKNRAKAKKLTIIWSIVGGVIALAIALAIFLTHTDKVNVGVGIVSSIVIGYAVFAMVYCIISASYIGEVFLWCSKLSIKFPGLIFSWDLEGFAWLIVMKILFAVLGFLVGVFALFFAIALSSFLSFFSFPFVLVHNIHTNYEDTLFMPDTPSGHGGHHRKGGR